MRKVFELLDLAGKAALVTGGSRGLGLQIAMALGELGPERIRSQAPLLRIGDDEDLKGAAVLFASDAGKPIAGQVLAVDGGVSAVLA